MIYIFFFFNDTATTEIYTLSLHDALPIFSRPRSAPHPQTPRIPSHPKARQLAQHGRNRDQRHDGAVPPSSQDRKSTRLNSSHANISYAVFCLKKKKNILQNHIPKHSRPCS